MKKLLSVILTVLLLFTLTACGGGGNADSQYAGKYISVAGEMLGVVLTGEDIEGFEIELKSGGKGSMTVDGDSAGIKWSNEENIITINVEGEEFTATHSDDTLKFTDFMGTGMSLTLALEGSAAADPSLYIPESDKAMVGTWTSYAVTDILGDDVSGEIDPEGLTITFNSDYTASGDIIGIDLELEEYSWSMLDTWGSFNDAEGCVISSWELTENGELEVTYDDDENYYIFICKK